MRAASCRLKDGNSGLIAVCTKSRQGEFGASLSFHTPPMLLVRNTPGLLGAMSVEPIDGADEARLSGAGPGSGSAGTGGTL